MLKVWVARISRGDDIFVFLLGYRWLSLLPAALALALNTTPSAVLWLVFVAALVDNVLLTAFYPRINRAVVEQPRYFIVDLLMVAVFLSLTGGASSPYYLYALSPLLAAAFFTQMRGALRAAGALSLLYGLALVVGQAGGRATADLFGVLTQVVSFFLIALVFGYPSILLHRIRDASAELARTHDELLRKNISLERSNRELESIHGLALAMQSSSIDVYDVQEKILTTITGELQFERAMLALVEPDSDVLIGWLTHRRRSWDEAPDGLFHATEIGLRPESGLVAQAVLSGEARYVSDGAPPTADEPLNQRLNLAPYVVLPLVMRDHPVGVLLVDNPDSRTPIPADSLRSLVSIANQAAIALGSTRLCVERAHRLAVEEERNRIAMEIHDTASQSLFGMVYALDACVKLLPEKPDEVRARLADTRAIAQRTMYDLRRSVYDIWSGGLGPAEFEAELRAHLRRVDAPASLAVNIDVCGELAAMSEPARKHLLRIAEEALSNVAKHSRATEAAVRVAMRGHEARLTVEDNGIGFDVQQSREAGFGLKSVRERARSLGAAVCLDSAPGGGTRLEVVVKDCVAVARRGADAYPARG
ncbi:MAG: GAF domain-containing sensor histidine kinase [Chloroflexi bacterium]|nr:GAF domain-containing sensor histidine kinase [Chloroflexota bacterium]